MIDEVREVEQYHNGKNIGNENLYRICYLLACSYKSKGLTKAETRQAIFDWGKKYGVRIKYDVNAIVIRAFDSANPTFKSPVVKINKQDYTKIIEWFDNKKTRLVALALLCYAKAHANKKGEFYISAVALGAWLKINRKALRARYIKELLDFEYLVEIEKPSNNNKWNEDHDKQATKYKLNASLHNSGEHVLVDNDIGKLYSQVFSCAY